MPNGNGEDKTKCETCAHEEDCGFCPRDEKPCKFMATQMVTKEILKVVDICCTELDIGPAVAMHAMFDALLTMAAATMMPNKMIAIIGKELRDMAGGEEVPGDKLH